MFFISWYPTSEFCELSNASASELITAMTQSFAALIEFARSPPSRKDVSRERGANAARCTVHVALQAGVLCRKITLYVVCPASCCAGIPPE